MEFRALGPLEVLDGGRLVPLGGTKQRAVLALLLLRAGTLVSADALTEAVWGECPPQRSRAVLQVYVANVRKALEPDRGRGTASTRISTAAAGYRLRVGPDELDLHRYQRILQEAGEAEDPTVAATLLSAADALWRGTAFPDLLGGVAPPELARIAEQRLVAQEDRVDALLAAGQHHTAVGELAELVVEQPLRERLRRQRVLALYRSGRQAEALQEYRAARAELADELGIDPSPAFQRLERAILRQDPALDAPRPREVTRGADGLQVGRLPVPPTPLIGRQQELSDLTALFGDPQVRLVTLHGTGGAGKTRLALAFASALTTAYAGGVHFVPLAPVSDPRVVLPVVAAGLGLTEDSNGSLTASLRARLGNRPLLAVLDNFEQVVDAAPVVARLLDELPTLRVLVTSRTALRLRAEHLYPVPPLPAAHADALFVERARAVCPAFVLDPTASAEVATICRQLDRLPLAIELAAARMRTLEPRELLARLGRQMSLLTGGPRDTPDRHRTLRATIRWSYDLLTPSERHLLARLSVFAGSGTLAAIETVCGGGLDVDPLDGVQALMDNSLLHVVRGKGEPRYSTLQTVRQFAAEQLAATPEAEDVHRRHAHFYLRLVETAEPHLTTAGQRGAVHQLESEYDNVRAALTWASSSGAHDLGLRLAGALGHFWEMTARFTEGRLYLSAALAAAPSAPPLPRAKALSAAGTLASRQADFQDALRRHQEALDLYRLLDDTEGAAFSLNNLAVQATSLLDPDSAERWLEDTLSLTRNPRLAAMALINLGEIALVRGDDVRATHLHQRALQQSIDAEDEWVALVSRYNLAVSLIHRTSYRAAGEHLHVGLVQAHARQDASLVTEYLSALATVAARTGQSAVAARLLGAVTTLRASTGVPPSAQDAALFQLAAEDVRRALGPTAFAAERALGRGWDLEAAVAAGVAAGEAARRDV